MELSKQELSVLLILVKADINKYNDMLFKTSDSKEISIITNNIWELKRLHYKLLNKIGEE